MAFSSLQKTVSLLLCLLLIGDASASGHGHSNLAAAFRRAASGSTPTSKTSTTGSLPASSNLSPGSATVTEAPLASGKYSQADLDKLWSLAGPVQPPPFTTTVEPALPIALPSPPPPLYPDFYSPPPAQILANLSFPKNFSFGVASSAYQVEGAVKDEGRGPSVWDQLTKIPGVVSDNTTGDVVGLHYYLYKEDIARIAALGFNHHSFSISWSRIYPFGSADSPVNQQGLDHYSDVINYHLSMGIEPAVVLFHYDLPLALLQKWGSISSPDFVEDFVNYATTVFKAYNGRVKTWLTFNEPVAWCALDAIVIDATSGSPNGTTDTFNCVYYSVLAHVAAVKAFRALNISGEISFKNAGSVGVPWRTNATEDQEAVEHNAAFYLGLFSDPVFTTGDWPQIIKDTLDPSILPRFTDQQIKDNKGSADFFAVDIYGTQYIKAPDGGISACVNDPKHPLWPICAQDMSYDTNGWPLGTYADPASSFITTSPQYLRYALGELHKRWPSKSMLLSEFGFSEPFEGQRTDIHQIMEDSDRTDYLVMNLAETLLAIHDDGIPLTGAFTWSLIDNLEWISGTTIKFGIQHVNYTTLERTFKRSAFSLSEFYEAHKS